MARSKGKLTLDRTRTATRNAIDEAQARNATPPAQDPDDVVDVASADSMDASDPPSFTPTTAARDHAAPHRKPSPAAPRRR